MSSGDQRFSAALVKAAVVAVGVLGALGGLVFYAVKGVIGG